MKTDKKLQNAKQTTPSEGTSTPLKQSKERAKIGVKSTPSPQPQVSSPKNIKKHQITKGAQQGIARLKEDPIDARTSDKKESPNRSPFSYASVSPSKSPLPSPSASPSGKKSPYRPNQNKYKGTQ